MIILGISCFYHDSAAALLINGEIVAAAQEERFTRKKHDANFPTHAIEFCLKQAGIKPEDVDLIAFYEKPFLKFERLIETYIAFAPQGFRSFVQSMGLWLKEKLFQRSILIKTLTAQGFQGPWDKKILFTEHHQSHAASAFFPSPFQEAAVLTMDGVGEWATTSLSHGRGNQLKMLQEIHFPHSLGLLYSAFTYYTGFKVNSGEYKVMGLAPYGEPTYVQKIYDHLIDVKADGSFCLDMSYFNYCAGFTMTNKKFDALFGGPPRTPEMKLTQREMDLAKSIQVVCEEIVLKLCKQALKTTGSKNLCLAGGVALNCVANGRVLRELDLENIWIQPAAGDAGGALGAALMAEYHFLRKDRTPKSHDAMKGSYLGPSFSASEIQKTLDAAGARYEKLSDQEIIQRTSQALSEEKAIGWFQGRMEYGPRALGNRSILGDPRSAKMQKTLNLKVKYRESFRPFAPSVLHSHVQDWFEIEKTSPYMLLVADLKKNLQIPMTEEQKKLFGIEKLNIPRSKIPAVTHVDYSARIQTVHPETNERYHALIQEFYKNTGCPVVVNTSFNVRGEPIVCTPHDAFRCFMGTGIEVLVVENFWLEKAQQSEDLKQDYKNQFELD